MLNLSFKIVENNADIATCFALLSELRPHLIESEFVRTIRLQEKEGYRLVCARSQAEIVACAGFRILNNLASGKTFYIDDLVTSSTQRSKGIGTQLLQWLKEHALQNSCTYFHLDSGVERHAAHSFYFKNGLHIVYYHFAQTLQQITQLLQRSN